VVGRPNYVGMGGYYVESEFPQYRGIFNYNSRNKLVHITDGTSQTIMFAEISGGYIGWGGSGGIPNGASGYSGMVGYHFPRFDTPYVGSPSDPVNSKWWAFSSTHTDHINVAMGDASVQQIGRSIDFATWIYLTGMADNVPVNW